MIKASVEITEPTPLNMYMANLHDYLGPYCFISGSFVVEDFNQTLQKFLFSCNPTTNNYFKSHDKFQHDKSKPIYECSINIVLTCTGCHPSDKPVPILNLKWYPFFQGKWYVYLKMERYPTFTKNGKLDINHVQKWVDRHVFGKIKDHCVKKREDCENDKDGCHPETNKINFHSYRVESQEPVQIIESHQRMGDEFFIPLGVSEYLLDHPQKAMFTNVSNKVTISPAQEKFSPSNLDVINELNQEYDKETFGGKSMPYTIRKLPNRRLYTVKGPGRTFAKGTTLEKAKKQVRLLYSIDRRKETRKRRQK